MEEVIKNELGLDSLESFGGSAGGCISRGGGYHTDKVGDVFIKFNDKQDVISYLTGFDVISFIFFRNQQH